MLKISNSNSNFKQLKIEVIPIHWVRTESTNLTKYCINLFYTLKIDLLIRRHLKMNDSKK